MSKWVTVKEWMFDPEPQAIWQGRTVSGVRRKAASSSPELISITGSTHPVSWYELIFIGTTAEWNAMEQHHD